MLLVAATRVIVRGRAGRAKVGVGDLVRGAPDRQVTGEVWDRSASGRPRRARSRPSSVLAAARMAAAVALDEFGAPVEVAAPEVVLGELARDRRQPGQRSAVSRSRASSRLARTAARSRERSRRTSIASSRSTWPGIVSVERDPLQLGVQGGPCRPVGDAGDGRLGAAPRSRPCLGSEDGFGGDGERVEVLGARLAQQRDGVALLTAGGGGRDGRSRLARSPGSGPRRPSDGRCASMVMTASSPADGDVEVEVVGVSAAGERDVEQLPGFACRSGRCGWCRRSAPARRARWWRSRVGRARRRSRPAA